MIRFRQIGLLLFLSVAINLACSHLFKKQVQGLGRIEGVVTDSANSEPLVGATILLEGTKMGAVTNEHGRYTAVRVPAGLYRIRCSMVAYLSKSIDSVRVTAGETTKVSVKLARSPADILLGK